MNKVVSWFFEPFPRGRIAALRTILYSFIFVDVVLTTAWVAGHNGVPTGLYQPLWIGRWLPLPEPTAMVITVVEVALLAFAAIGATGRLPRVAGTAVFLLYAEWMFIAMSYGKVDHDRVAFLVALAVLPTVGRARWGDRTEDEASGWAIRSIQIAVVITYLFAAFAKFRYGGLDWATGATLMRAVLRRGTFIGDIFAAAPIILTITQWGIIAFELFSPLMLMRNRFGRFYVVMAFLFHLVTYATITIIFFPHVMCLFAFLPLEKWRAPSVLARLRPHATASG